jgi:hypothetical protein
MWQGIHTDREDRRSPAVLAVYWTVLNGTGTVCNQTVRMITYRVRYPD